MEWILWMVAAWVVLSVPAAMAVGQIIAFGRVAELETAPIADHASRAA